MPEKIQNKKQAGVLANPSRY